MARQIYEDDFTQTFVNQQEFIEFLHERENNSRWERYESKEIQFKAMDEADYMFSIDENVYADTFKNTQLLLKASGGEEYPVRTCAIKTICERARVSGNALNKVPKRALADIFNHCMKVSPGYALLRHSENKISAVNGGDASDYAPLPIPELFGMTTDYLDTKLPGSIFAGGFYGHAMASALWELTNHDELLETYKEALKKHGITPKTMKPALRLSSSDVGVSGANLFPMLIYDGEKNITLGNALRLEHKASKGATLEAFGEQLEMIFAQYEKAIGGLTGLLETEIRYPANCMLGVMKKIGLTKKLSFEAVDLFKAQYGEDPCTAHNIYFGICEVIFMLQCNGADGLKLVENEEKIARTLTMRWTDYDMPGEVKW